MARSIANGAVFAQVAAWLALGTFLAELTQMEYYPYALNVTGLSSNHRAAAANECR
jgi:hypothetical protein